MKKYHFAKLPLAILLTLLIIKGNAQNLNQLSWEELDRKAYLHIQVSEYEEATPYVEKLIELAEKAGVDTMIYSARFKLSELLREQGEFQEAEKLLLDFIGFTKKHYGEKSKWMVDGYSSLGLLYEYMEEIDLAEEYYLKAMQTHKNNFGENDLMYASILNNLGIFYESVHRYQEAEPIFLKTLNILIKKVGKYDFKYTALANNLANLYEATNRFEEAEILFVEILEIDKKLNGASHPQVAETSNNLATLYESLEQFDKAEELYKDAIRIYKLNGKTQTAIYAGYLQNLGRLYKDLDRFETSIPLLKEAIPIYQRIYPKGHTDLANTYNNLGEAYKGLGEYDRAESIVFDAFNNNVAGTIENEMDLFEVIKLDFKDVLMAKHSFEILKEISNARYVEKNSPELLMLYYNSLKVAIEYAYLALDKLHKKEDKLFVAQSFSGIAIEAIKVAQQLYELNKEQKYLDETLIFAEHNKSIVLSSSLQGNKAMNFGDIPPELADQEQSLKEELASLKSWLTQAQDEMDSVAVHELEQEIININIEQTKLRKKLEAEFPKYVALKYQSQQLNPNAIKELLKNLPNSTAILEYYIHEKGAYVILINSSQVKLYPIRFEEGELKTQVAQLRMGLSNYEHIFKNPQQAFDNYSSAAFFFYNKLIQPLKADLSNIKSLVIVPDGLLGHIPFEVLLSQNATQLKEIDYKSLPYLLNDYNISYSYSASLLLENKTQKRDVKTGILAFAAHYPENSSASWMMRSPSHQATRKQLGDLPAVQEEVKQLKKSFGTSLFYLKNEATEANFKKQANNYAVLHLAMHGVLNHDNPLQSALVFSEDGDTLEDNFLEAHEISSMQLHNDLVVLSACETGFGKFEQGEGVMSLARSFMYAGVPSLVVSLWQVNDGSTAILMNRFYENLSEGMTKDVALRDAKLFYLKRANGIASHPAFWSAFIQLGDTQAINLGKKWNWMIWGAAVGLLLLLIGVVVWRKKKLSYTNS